MSTLPKTYITPEQYLEIDRQAERKSEYYDGEMFAMAGAGWAHNLIVCEPDPRARHSSFAGGPCTRSSERHACSRRSTGRYVYPDATVVCGKPQFADDRRDILLNPTVIFEVLSPSTASFDRGFKFDAYTAIPSLREYVLDRVRPHIRVEVFSRQAGRPMVARARQSTRGVDRSRVHRLPSHTRRHLRECRLLAPRRRRPHPP